MTVASYGWVSVCRMHCGQHVAREIPKSETYAIELDDSEIVAIQTDVEHCEGCASGTGGRGRNAANQHAARPPREGRRMDLPDMLMKRRRYFLPFSKRMVMLFETAEPS